MNLCGEKGKIGKVNKNRKRKQQQQIAISKIQL